MSSRDGLPEIKVARDAMLKVLYDGWSLVYAPNSPEALHLYSLLQHHPEIQALVALPGDPPDWLPPGVQNLVHPTPDTPRGRLAWEQRSLPRMVSELEARLLHQTSANPPLFGNAARVVSPAENPNRGTTSGIASRLRDALGRGGMSRLGGLLWPSDLKAALPQNVPDRVYYLPFPSFPSKASNSDEDGSKLQTLDLPETYILCHGPVDSRSLRRTLDAWSWVAGPVGEHYPLLILGLDLSGSETLRALLSGSDLANTLRALPMLDPPTIDAVYRKCYAVFHPAQLSAWGMAGRSALHYGKPLVAAESPLADALAGPSAYLLPENDTRTLGAGLLTVIVEEPFHQELGQAAQQRASAWDQRSFQDELLAAYQAILDQG